MNSETRLVVIGASAGGQNVLKRLLRRLPADFPAAILIVVHIGSHPSILPKILAASCSLRTSHAHDGEPIVPGSVLIAPPGHHLLVVDGKVRLSKGAKENFARPAIDPLFRSAAVYHREKVIGVVLSGMMDDGTIGLQAIKAYGGIALVQDPDDAEEPSMPQSALQHVEIDASLPAERLADRMNELVRTPVRPVNALPVWEAIDIQRRFDLLQEVEVDELDRIAAPSGLTCPECHGSLWQLNEVSPAHFRCHTGHAYTAQGLSAAQQDKIEEAIWIAIRALHEKKMLLQRFGRSAEQSKRMQAAEEHFAAAQTLAKHADTLLRMIAEGNGDKAGRKNEQ